MNTHSRPVSSPAALMPMLELGSVSLLLLLGTATVHAGDNVNGFYLGASAGVNFAERLKSDIGNGETSLEPGARVNLFTGYGFEVADHLTLAPELEAGFIYNSFGKGSVFGVNTSGGGSLRQVPVLANVLLDWPVAPKFNAYLGVGLGMEYMNVSVSSGSPLSAMATTEGGFVWQFKAGIQYTLGPGDIGLGYQYLDSSAEFYDNFGNNTILASYTIHF